MIKVTRISEDLFEILPVLQGATFDPAHFRRTDLPKFIKEAICTLFLVNIGDHFGGVGVHIAEDVWELDDACLTRNAQYVDTNQSANTDPELET